MDTIDRREIRHFHLFCGLGGGARGFNKGTARVGNMVGVFRCIGGIDVDPASINDFSRLAGVPGTVLDLFDREQYQAFHGLTPPEGWREATPADIHAAAGHERPHIVFLSAPCKGFSGLLSETKSKSDKYQALNKLTLRGVFLMLEAFKDDPVELIVFENVPRIATRGRVLLDRIGGLLRAYGYIVNETTHDCGHLGGLAQSRKRFLLVARHAAKVPPFLYEPPKRSLRSVGDVLGRMPLPGDLRAGPMHRVPRLSWQTWVRLAFVQAGSDWRSLSRLAIQDGMLRDFALQPDRGSCDGVGQGDCALPDPRHGGVTKFNNCYRIIRWDEFSPAVTGGTGPSAGELALTDLRPDNERKFANIYRVTPWDKPTRTVIGRTQSSDGAMSVADPRPGYREGTHSTLLRVTDWEDQSSTITGAIHPAGGAISVADPRPGMIRERGDAYATAGHYGVSAWDASTGAVSAAACHDNGSWSVADPRLPEPSDRVISVIRALDGTWHRPFTTFELAGLQSLIDPEEQLELDGLSDSAWRERIGNAVPPDAAQAIASTMGQTLLLAWSGEGFMLSSVPIWVRPAVVAISVQTPAPG